MKNKMSTTTKAAHTPLHSLQPSLSHSASVCICGHGEGSHVGQNFENDPVHICTECSCRSFKAVQR